MVIFLSVIYSLLLIFTNLPLLYLDYASYQIMKLFLEYFFHFDFYILNIFIMTQTVKFPLNRNPQQHPMFHILCPMKAFRTPPRMRRNQSRWKRKIFLLYSLNSGWEIVVRLWKRKPWIGIFGFRKTGVTRKTCLYKMILSNLSAYYYGVSIDFCLLIRWDVLSYLNLKYFKKRMFRGRAIVVRVTLE